AAQDFDDDWERAGQLEIAAGALAEAGVLDGEGIIASLAGLANEFARGEAFGRLYPHLRRGAPSRAQTLCAAIGSMKDDWAKADAVAALANRMGQYGDRAELHALLGIAEAIDNKWAAAHALGKLASALAMGGDPDDLTQALKSMAGYKLPGWRRA